MFWNRNGYMLFNSILSLSLFLLITLTLLPSISTLYKELSRLQDRREWILILHNEIRQVMYLNENMLPMQKAKTHKGIYGHLTFQTSNALIKGCLEWENHREQLERVCLYAKPPK